MAKVQRKKPDDIPKTVGASLGSSGPDVERLQKYLGRFGYFDNGVHQKFGMQATGSVATPGSPGEFCEGTQKALKKFQQFSGLSSSGILDQETVALMLKKRCGHLDVGTFVAQGIEQSSLGKEPFPYIRFQKPDDRDRRLTITLEIRLAFANLDTLGLGAVIAEFFEQADGRWKAAETPKALAY